MKLVLCFLGIFLAKKPHNYTKPIIQPIIETIIQPIIQVIIQPIIQPIIQLIIEPVIQPILQPIIQPIILPIIETIIQPIIQKIQIYHQCLKIIFAFCSLLIWCISLGQNRIIYKYFASRLFSAKYTEYLTVYVRIIRHLII